MGKYCWYARKRIPYIPVYTNTAVYLVYTARIQAEGVLKGVTQRPPTPAKEAGTPAPTQDLRPRKINFYGTEVLITSPAGANTPETPGLLKMIRDAGVSKTLSALSDDALKDEALCAELVQSLTPEALQAAGLSRQDD